MFIKKFYPLVRYCHMRTDTRESLRSEWKSVIGLEIHVQLLTKSKLFSPASVMYGAPTNDSVTLFDAAIPGTLPVLNKKAVELAVATALALGCKINPTSYFDRKHYFYSDLPAGYQITQQRLPIAVDGKLEYAVFQSGVHKNPYYRTSYIKQVQLEQDSGKSFHENSQKQCFIDLNRAGVALVEIVFQPDVEDEYEACALVKEVIKILERVGSCSCKMEEGALRVDANVSIHKDCNELGIRTEIKNLGSINAISNAIKYEVNRQVRILNSGGFVKNETLAWDSDFNQTKPMREKEEKQDYRFMPEPNLPPLRLLIDEDAGSVQKNTTGRSCIYNLSHLKHKVLVLPQDDREMLMKKYGLSDVYAFNLVNQNKLLNYFKEIMEGNSSRNPKEVYLLLMYKLLNSLNESRIELDDCFISAQHLGELLDLHQSRRISKGTVEFVIQHLLKTDTPISPIKFVDENNLYIISSPEELRKICLRVIEEEQETVSLLKNKKRQKSAHSALISKVIERSNYRADTKVLPKLMTEVLEEINDK